MVLVEEAAGGRVREEAARDVVKHAAVHKNWPLVAVLDGQVGTLAVCVVTDLKDDGRATEALRWALVLAEQEL